MTPSNASKPVGNPIPTDSVAAALMNALAIDDIYVRDAHVYTEHAFDPATPIEDLPIQFRINVQEQAEGIECGPTDDRQKCLRYFVDTGLRVLKPGTEQQEAIADESILAAITAQFVVKYRLMEERVLSESDVQAFTKHAVHHMWPYWREFLQATSARLRLPPIMLPMKPPIPRPEPAPNSATPAK